MALSSAAWGACSGSADLAPDGAPAELDASDSPPATTVEATCGPRSEAPLATLTTTPIPDASVDCDGPLCTLRLPESAPSRASAKGRFFGDQTLVLNGWEREEVLAAQGGQVASVHVGGRYAGFAATPDHLSESMAVAGRLLGQNGLASLPLSQSDRADLSCDVGDVGASVP